MNKARFDKMPPAHQKALVDSAREAAAYQRDFNMKDSGRIIQELKKIGFRVVEQPDLAPFRKVVYEPVSKAYAEKNGTDLINAIEAEQ
jgi:TRAP-type C4-dicarboxylate transport system substrate-binding protein